MVRKILIGLVVMVLAFVVVVAVQPATFHLERSVSISAPPENAFALVNDFHSWRAWSPWEGKDPALKRTFSGPAAGPGAVYAWQGNDEVGEGRMTIERSDKPSLVGIKLEFIKPFAVTNTATFTFVPTAGGSKVTWAMEGKNDFVGKLAHLLMDMDKLVGADFERGLAKMKQAAEQAAKSDGPIAEASK